MKRPTGTRGPRLQRRLPGVGGPPGRVETPQDVRGLNAALRRYLEHRAVLGSTAAGLWSMEYKLRQFIGWAEERGVTHPGQVSRQVIERYQRWLYHYRKANGEPLSVTSRRTRVVPLKGFFRWLTREGEIPANPAADIDLPRMIYRLPRGVLSATEVERVLALADTTSVLGLRDRALLEVFYATGMRRLELANLALGDIDAERGVVLIRQGKGRRDRLIPMGERALHWVAQYLEQARPALAWNADEKAIFLGREGQSVHPAWLTQLVRGYIKRAELGKHGSCHLLRHTMATLMLEGGADIRFVQAMLGHAELSTTQIYTHVAVTQLQRVHARTHPGSRLRKRTAQSVDQGDREVPDGPAPSPDEENAAQALLEALAGEAAEEREDDESGDDGRDDEGPGGDGVAADA